MARRAGVLNEDFAASENGTAIRREKLRTLQELQIDFDGEGRCSGHEPDETGSQKPGKDASHRRLTSCIERGTSSVRTGGVVAR